MKKIGIKIKLVGLFIIMKVIPLLFIVYIAITGVKNLNEYFASNTQGLFESNRKIITATATNAINDSIEALDQKSKITLEKFSVSLASKVADFLYERDNDILFLSKITLKQKIIDDFFNSKNKDIYLHEKYIYSDATKKWTSSNLPKKTSARTIQNAQTKDNEKHFNFEDPIKFKTKNIPIYREITYFDLEGNEIYKKSNTNSKKLNISKKENTYCKAEDYFEKIQNLKNGDIFVSDVIGAYVPSKIIGTFTKEKAKKANIKFKPENHGYAGIENPVGKKFEGIIRFITPIYKKSKKIGYISLALDHRHIMEFTDTFCHSSHHIIRQNISNAGTGNYAFMWDYEGRNISHPRDYFIVGFNAKTGKRVPGWLSAKVADDFKKSEEKDLNYFLEAYPKFENQSLKQKPNIKQLKELGEVGLDCRYLNFAPQCQGWMQLTENGGYGSFIIFWSGVWKLTTAATIPYYTGQYGNTKRGFGFITIGANVDEFHKAANKTKENLDTILLKQTTKMEQSLKKNIDKVSSYIGAIIRELTFVTAIMIFIVIFIAIWMSNYITGKIEHLIEGTNEFAQNHLDYQIEVTSNDEIGNLEHSFNDMANKIKEKEIENKEKDFLLIQQSKMAEMGDMMSAIIHQWKQPLSVISIISTGAKLNIDLDISTEEKTLDSFNTIEEQIKIMSQTINDFSNFFKPTIQKKYNLETIVNDVYRMLKGVYKSKGVFINYTNKKTNVIIDGYPTELMQVLINILNNARDAILEKNSKQKTIDIKLFSDKNYGIIEITDYAGGIPENLLDSIFEPYFTTKKEDKGTGIGLNMSMNIVKKTNGKLLVKNTTSIIDDIEYTGAQFTIKLQKEE